jgi:hypothetical protein
LLLVLKLQIRTQSLSKNIGLDDNEGRNLYPQRQKGNYLRQFEFDGIFHGSDGIFGLLIVREVLKHGRFIKFISLIRSMVVINLINDLD